MSANSDSENRLLDASELEIVGATRSPTIEQLSMEQLKTLVHRLRQAHGRAKDISARQQRETREKMDSRGAERVQDNTCSMAKVQVLLGAIQRVDEELSRRDEVSTPTQADLSRHALELKLSSQTIQHPDPGRSASEGMRPKKRQEPIKIGTTKKEIGRVTQAGKVAQARKDDRNG
jgi:hypothetical protein